MALHPWRLLSLCAGVGGLDLGVRLAEPAARSVCYVEREAAAASILVARMEDGWLHQAPIWSDLATFDAGAWRGAVDCVVSGDPCQPNSVAGRGLGDADERWLADRVVDVFDRSGACRLFRENVPGNADGQLAYFVPALEGLGCRIAVGLFSAKELGFAHRRERLFIMADRLGGGQSQQSQLDRQPLRPEQHAVVDATCERPREGRPKHAGQQGPRPASGAGGKLAKSDDPHLQGRRPSRDTGGREEQARHARLGGGGMDAAPLLAPGPADVRWVDIIRRSPDLAPAHSGYDRFAIALRNEGFAPDGRALPEEWRHTIPREGKAFVALRAAVFQAAAQSQLRRIPDELADRVDRLRACGNGVVPLVAGYAWRTLEARLAAASAGDVAVSAVA